MGGLGLLHFAIDVASPEHPTDGEELSQGVRAGSRLSLSPGPQLSRRERSGKFTSQGLFIGRKVEAPGVQLQCI